MKKLYFLGAALVLGFCGFGQMRVALVGGAHAASVDETNSLPGWELHTKPYYSSKTGIHLGFIGDLPLGDSRHWSFQPGLLFMAKGRKYAQVNDTASAALSDTLVFNKNLATNYIDLPLNLAFKLPLGKSSNFFLSAGPYLGFFLSGKQTVETRAYSNNKFNKDETTLEVGKGDNKARTVDFGWNARAGFELGPVILSAFMSQGLTDFYQAGYPGSFKHKLIGGSLGIWLNRAPDRKPKDSDKDGIPDEQDLCPTLAGTAATGGCPDQDGDGVPDKTDKCPAIAGLAKYNGCPIPDSDGDGINDEEDQCPTVKGLAKYHGCPIPDTDGDGINDEIDMCPDKPGIAEYNGCPIPDSDGDGINDKEDKCPNQAGTRENNGCPEIKKEIVEKVNYAARNIFFDVNSDKILTKSNQSLDEVAQILMENEALSLIIAGYTDNAGRAAYNLELSQKRADAVRNYLIKKGIAADRLSAKGYGQENPVADNSTAAGKARNRRVELKLE